MTNKRVAIFSPQLSNVGTAQAMWNYAVGLEAHGYEVDLVRAGEEWRGKNPLGEQVRVVRLPTAFISTRLPDRGTLFRLSSLFVALVSIVALAWYLRRNKPDVVIAGLHPLAARLALTLSSHRGKFVVSVQGLPRSGRLRNRVWRYLATRSDSIIVPVESIGGLVRNISSSPNLKCDVIPNPVLDDSYQDLVHPVPDHRWFRDKSTPIVLGAGRLSNQKNFRLLIESFAEVRKKIIARLVIVGEGELRSELEHQIADLNVGEFVDLPGHVTNPLSYMAHSDVFVLTSKWEGPGHVLIEALSTGTPCVSVDCPHGPREILGDGRYGTITSEDPSQIALAIVHSVQSYEAQRNRSGSGVNSVGVYTPDSVSEKLGRLTNLLEGRSSTS